MSIDTGLNTKFNTAVPIAGVKQSSQGIRDNFAVIKRAIESLQEIGTASSSMFAVEAVQSSDGSMALDIGYRNNAFILPTGDPTVTPTAGMVRFHNGVFQIHNGSSWGLVSGATVADIIAALELDPAAWTPTADRHGVMTDPTLHALAIANGNAGFMSGTDKAKLDNLSISFNAVEVSGDNISATTIIPELGSSSFKLRAMAPLTVSVVGKEIRLGADIPQQAATPNGSGFMSAADKTKLDSLVATEASILAKGYMSAADKVKLNNLAQAFTRINVNNGPLLATDNGTFEITGSNGVSVTAIPGQQKINISINNIGGYSPSALATTIANFNSQRSRNTTAIADTANEQISHTKNQNATVDILFSWDFAGQTTDIDGFRITVSNSLSSSVYSIGASAITERVYDVPSDRRSFVLSGAIPNNYYTIFVQGLRYVETDINALGVILGTPRKCTLSGKNPYRPEVTAEFAGSLSGTLNGLSIDQLLANIQAASTGATWSGITGTGKPQDNADVTALHTSLNTMNVGNKSSSQVLADISGLSTNVQSLLTSVSALQTGSPIAGSALQAYVTAAQLAQSQAQASAAQVQTQFNSITQTKITVEADRTAAQLAQSLAEAARDQAALSATTATSKASDASQSASAAHDSAQLTETYATISAAAATAAESSNLNATLTVAQARPYDFVRDALFWIGFTTAGQGVTFQTVSNVGRTYRQTSGQPGWIAPKQGFLTGVFRRIRATVKARYVVDGLDPNGQTVALEVRGIDGSGVYQNTELGLKYTVPGKASGGALTVHDGWQEFALEFVANSEFETLFKNFNICFVWNKAGGNGTIEILTFLVEDVTESSSAEISAAAAVTASSAALVARDDAQTRAQAASDSAVSAATAAGQASTYRTDAAESAQTAQDARTTATQQAGVATNAALDSQVYSSAAAAHAQSAFSDANRAENSAGAVITAAATADSASQNAQTAASAASGYAQTALTSASDAAASATSAAASAVTANSSSDSAASSAAAASVSADTAVTKSSDAEQSAAAAHQSETAAQSYKEGADSSAQAASLSASSARTNATLTTQYADAAERSSLSAKITYATLLPSNFNEDGKYWSKGSTGTTETRLTLPPTGTYIADPTYGKIFQSPAAPGTISPVGAQLIAPNRIYRVSVILRATTQNTGASAALAFYAACLNTALDTELRTISIGSANPQSYTAGWTTYTKDITSNDFGNANYFRPVLSYNQTAGTQTIQVREMRVEDVTESKNSATSAAASLDSMKTVLAYKTETIQYATAVQVQAANVSTAAGTASSAATQAATSAADALGYRNSASASQIAAANSATLAGNSATAASGSANTAATYATEASTSAAAAMAASINASTSAGAILPSTFATDGTEWIIENGTATYQDLAGYGRTARIVGGGGESRIMPFQYLLPEASRVYRATVKARYYADGAHPSDQKAMFAFEGFNPSSATPCTSTANTIGVQQATKVAADGWATFSTDFQLITTSVQLRVKFVFNAGVGGLGDGTIEIISFRLEDITESTRAKGFADASFTNAANAQAYQDDAQEAATVATTQAGLASTSAGDASNYASQALSSKQDAEGAATTATTQAGIATTAKNNAQGSATAAATSASQAASSATDAGNSATSASGSANTASITANGTQVLAAQLMPGDFSLDSTFFTNALTGQTPGNVTVGTFVTLT